MAGGRPLFALLALILLGGGILLDIFMILSGVISTTPMPKIWFIEAATGGIGSSPPVAAWTYFSLCTYSNGVTSNCGKVKPAFPFNPPENFGASKGLPASMIGTHEYYYLSRFAWVFYLVALFFAAIALFTGILALCTRIGSYLSGLNAFLAMFFQAAAASLMTAWTVLARNAFRANGISTSLGRYAYGFTWASFACYFLAMIFFCVGGSAGRKDKKSSSSGQAGQQGQQSGGGGGGLFGRKPSTRSRETGVKDDYS